MARKSGVFGGMGVRRESRCCSLNVCMCDVNIVCRTPQQVTERLDRLIKEIREIQKPHMDGSKAVDVVVVRICDLLWLS